MNTLKFNAKSLAYIDRFKATNGTKFYLEGINFTQAPGSKGVIAITTDSHRMGIIHDEEGELTFEGDFLVSFEKTFIAACKKQGSKDNKSVVTIADNVATLLNKHGQKIAVGIITIIDCTFPDWKRVIPKKHSPSKNPIEHVAFNPKYLADFSINGKAPVHMRYVGLEREAVIIGVTEFPSFIGLLMPVKANPELTKLPWFLQDEQKG